MRVRGPVPLLLGAEFSAGVARGALITALGDADTRIRMSAAKTLGQIGPAAAGAVPALTTALDEPGTEQGTYISWLRQNANTIVAALGGAS